MKTLTYLSAYENALEDYHRLWRKTLRITDSVEWHHTQEITNKRYRQVDKFKQALTKRLQEQEEELERLREIDGAVVKQMLQCCDDDTEGENK